MFQAPEQSRVDTWRNFTTGVGTSRDKTTHGSYWAPWRVLDNELLALMNESDLAAKVVELPAREMMRRGYDLDADGVDVSEMEDFEEDLEERLRLKEQFQDGMKWGRGFGGDLLIVGADDGQSPDKPLNEKGIRSVEYLNNIDRRFAWVQSYYSDPFKPNYGLPEIYLITNVVSVSRPHIGTPGSTIVHESRTIRFDGNPTDVLTRQQLAGWSWSVLQRVYNVMRKFEHAFDSSGALLSDASQAVFKIQGLIDAIASGQKQAIQERMALVDESRSTIRAVLLDADGEEFTREPTSFAGIPDLLDRWMMRFASAANMPVTKLFGRSAAGLNATGENDVSSWYDELAGVQTDYVSPKLRRLLRLCALAKDSKLRKKDAKFKIEWCPLWAPSDSEQAKTDYATAQKDQIYLQEGVVTPEEVALDRQGQYPSMDVESREKALQGAKKFDPYEQDPLASAEASAKPPLGTESQSPAVPLPLPASPAVEGKGPSAPKE